jgi:hypothetical protein
MKILDPHLRDGVHEWRDGQRFVKQGYKLFLEGTDTLAGRYAPRCPARRKSKADPTPNATAW